jgi:hypothetical protein
MFELSDPDFIKTVTEKKTQLMMRFRKQWQERLAKDPILDEIIFDY